MKKMIGLGLAAALGLSAWGEVLDTSVFTRACTFTLSGYQGASTLVDFPVLVRLDRTIPGFDPACCGANGAGLRFADEAGNLLAHEVDTWDVSGESCVWVRVPSLSGTNTKIRLYCGAADGAQLPAVSSRDVWSKYIMVAHGGANGVADASPKQLAVANGGGLTMPTGTGLVGDGFTKTDRNKIGLLVPNPITNNTLTDSTRFTLSGWYRNALTGTAILMAGVDAWGKTGFLVLCEGGGYMSVAVAGHQGPTNPKLGALQQYKWNHVAFSYVTSGELNTYFDGVNIFSKTGANVLTDIGLEYWTFGSYSGITNGGNFGGDMDELRIYDGIASADWIQAEHDSMRNPSFAAVVAMETLAQPVDVAVNSAARGSAGITVKGTIATSAATATVALKWGLTPNLEGSPVALGSGSGTRAVEGTFPGTDATTRYYYAFEVTPVGGTAKTGAVYCTLDGVTGPVLDTTPFKRGCTFTLQGYTGASTLQNFPVLVRLSTAIPGFSYSDCAPNGADLRFVDESGKLLAHEIDTWNTAGESYVWVKVPSLMGQTTKIRLFFGVDDVVALPGVAPTDVWGAYVAVVHGGSTGVRNESPKGIVTSNGGGLVSSGASGVVGGGFAKAVVTRGSIGLQIQNPVKYGALTDTSRLTLSAWYRYMGSGTSILMSSKSAWAGTGFLTLCEQGTYMSVAVQSTHQGPSTDPKLGALVSGQWNHVAFSYVAAGQLNTYFDGLNIFSKADAKTLAHEDRENWAVGSYAETVNAGNFCGDMDEIRLYDGIASGDWIGAERASMVDPDFAKAVSVDNLVDVLPSEVSVSSVVRSDAGVAIAGTLTRLATGASQVTVTLKWGTTPAMTDGTVAVGTFTEASNFQCVFPGTDLTANYYYAFVMASDAGESTTSTDYRLFDPASAATWRPQTADDSWRSTAWLVDGAIRPFQQGWSVLFDGTETPYIDTLTNVAKLDLGTVTVMGDKDYTFTGDGELAAKRVVKTGSGTLTVDGRGFSGAVEWDVSGGTLKIGDSVKDGSGQSVLGTESTVNVHDGGTFDINSRSPQTLAAFNEPTRTLKVKIAGDGVDGKGALVNNDTTQIDGWGQHISRLELTGDATVGGPSRLDVRAFTGTGSTAPTNAVVTGPADATLRVIDNPRFNFCNTTVTQLGAIRAESNGKFFMETAGSMNLTRGLEIGEGGSIFLNGTGYTTPVTFLENTTGHFGGWSGVASAVQEGPLTVQNGATAIIDGGASQTMFKGAVTNNGTIVVKDLLNFYGPSIDGTGTIDQQGGGIRLDGSINSPETRITGTTTGGTWDLGQLAGNGYPKLAGVDIPAKGNVYLRTQISDTLDERWTTLLSGTGANSTIIVCRTDGDSDVTTTVSNIQTKVGEIWLGSGGGSGHMVLTGNTQLEARNISVGANDSAPKPSHLTIETGSSLSINAAIDQYVGRWSGKSCYPQRLFVDGGTYDALSLANATTWVGADSPFAFMELKGGEAKMWKLGVCSRMNELVRLDCLRAHDARFTQKDGTLTLGAGGIAAGNIYWDRFHFDFANGTMATAADWASGNYGINVAFGADPLTKGTYTVDLGGHKVSMLSQLAGYSDVTLTGGGSFATSNYFKGIPQGRWTVQSSVVADLSGAAGFTQGLTIEEDADVTLDIASDSCCEFAVFPTNMTGAAATWAVNATWTGVYAMKVDRMNYLHASFSTGPMHYAAAIYRGQFYVDDSQAGDWTFAGVYDDNIVLEIDGTTAFENTTWNAVNYKTVSLNAGWHDFRAIAFDLSGGAGSVAVADWKDKMGLGWALGVPDAPTAAASYQPFDTTTLKMRVKPVAEGVTGRTGVLWEHAAYNQNTWDSEKYFPNAHLVTNTLMAIHADANGFPSGKASCSRFTGFVKITDEQAGIWDVDAKYDDGIALWLDGEKIGTSGATLCAQWSAKATVTAGWHRFEIRVSDKSGAIGGSLTDSEGNKSALNIAINGYPAVSFDERHFRIVSSVMEDQTDAPTGLGGTTLVQDGGRLTNRATAGACPVYGMLGGVGTICGPFRFLGGTLGLEGSARALRTPFFENADEAMFAGLGGIKVTFDERPTLERYPAGPAYGLTDEAARNIKVEVELTGASASMQAKYADAFRAHVTAQGELELINRRGAGLTFIIR